MQISLQDILATRLLDTPVSVTYLDGRGPFPCAVSAEHAMRIGAAQDIAPDSYTETALQIVTITNHLTAFAARIAVLCGFEYQSGNYGDHTAMRAACRHLGISAEDDGVEMYLFTVRPQSFQRIARQRLGIA